MISILLMSDDVKIALISGGTGILTSLIGAIGAFHVSEKKNRQQQQADREKQHEDLKTELIKYHEKNREEIADIRQNDLREMRDDITDMGANLQQKMSDIETKVMIVENNLNLYSQKVDKHNNVIERVYHLEDTDKLLDERIKVANHRIEDLEKKA